MSSRSEQFVAEKTFPKADEIDFRPLVASDIGGAMRLKEQAGWNQTESDWARLLRLEPEGCFAAVAGEKLVGTATATIYGRELAWIGMVLVDRAYRRRGIATNLMKRALDFLDGRKIRAVKLDATPEGAFVYENLGFEAESTIERWSLAAARKSSNRQSDLSEVAEPEIFSFDLSHFAADRSELLRNLIAEACLPTVAIKATNGELAGYALARRGSRANYLGPLVAADRETAENLLDGVLANLAGDEIYIDANTDFKSFTRILSARGFIKQRELVRMRRGEKTRAASGDTIFAIGGLEVG